METTASTMVQPQRSFSQRSNRARSLSQDSSLSSIHEFVNTWEDEEDEDTNVVATPNTTSVHRQQQEHLHRDNHQLHGSDLDDDDDEHLMIPLTNSTDAGDERSNNHNNNNKQSNHTTSAITTTMATTSSLHNITSDSQNQHSNHNINNNNNNHSHHSRVEQFRDNHPNVTRFGSFFFFRSATSSTHNAAYAPSGPSVVGAAIDLSMPVLFNFHLFI